MWGWSLCTRERKKPEVNCRCQLTGQINTDKTLGGEVRVSTFIVMLIHQQSAVAAARHQGLLAANEATLLAINVSIVPERGRREN